MQNECLSPQSARPLNSQRGRCNRTSPNTWGRHRACDSTGAKPQLIDIPSEPPLSNPGDTMELIGRVTEADILLGDISVMALIDTGAQVSTITQDFCEQHGYDINPVKQMLHIEGIGGIHRSYHLDSLN